MRKTGRVLLVSLLLIVFVFAVCAFAQDVVLSVDVPRKSVLAGEEFPITYSISVIDTEKLNLEQLPDFRGFTVIKESKKRTRRMIVGQAYTNLIYSYVLKADERAGKKLVIKKLTIGRAVFGYDNVKYKTAPIDIEVKIPPGKKQALAKGLAKIKPEQAKPVIKEPAPATKKQEVGEDIAKIDENKIKVEHDDSNKSKKTLKVEDNNKKYDISVSASVNKPEPFVGEEVIYTFNFYHKTDYIGAPAFTPPSFTGFFVEELPQSREFEHVDKLKGEYVIEGVNYSLFPLVAGAISIPGATLEYKEEDGSITTIKSNPVDLKVNKIEKSDQAVSTPFSGGVGSFKISQKVEADKAVMEEPFNVVITIKGEGNINGISEPYFINNNDFDYTLIDTEKMITKATDGIYGDKSFVYSVVPKNEGKLTYKGAGYTYFDPVKKKYKEISTQEKVIKVLPSSKKKAKVKKKDLVDLDQILKPIRTGVKIKKAHRYYMTSQFYYIVLVLFLASLLAVTISSRKAFEADNMDIVIKRRAIKEALASIEEARSHLHKQNIENFYIEVHNLLNKFFVDKYGLDIIYHPLDSIERRVIGSVEVKKLIKELVDKIKLLNYFRYSKVDVTEKELKEYLKNLKKNIKEIKKCKE